MAKYPIGLATRFKPKRRKASRRRKAPRSFIHTAFTTKRKVRRGPHRPVVLWTGRRFKRPRRSKLFRRPTRINPRRHARRYRRNPLRLPMGLDRSLMAGLPVAGGIAISMFAMPQVAKLIPASLQKYNKFFGLVHVALGVAAMSFVKKDIVKTLGGTVLAMGLYDLIASNVPQLNLPPLPRGVAAVGSSYGADEIVGASFQEVGTDFTPAAMGSSYGDDIDYGGDSIEIG